ncbi:unnamed protein product [Clonostachys rosea f. rosea IK726]|uniref:Enoyl reductase (ER) domain-containing protein n=3 Tax=Bionectria ochroleuca TaxID=29856 RepID=A0A0B7K6L3_BIOOC|nr:unnamed protein product [Clonostachys rosea f. rosea IK726]CAG9951406.1 unnamed protein product [Clonostachys rosea f. rosea IK726]
MKQWVTLMDGIDRLQVQEVPEPIDIKEDEVLVRINAVAINHRDIKIINGDFKGRYATPTDPMVPTSDASGTIVKVGRPAAATKWREGDRVLGLVRPTHLTGPTRSEHHALGLGFPQPGVLTEYRVFSASGLVQIPQGLSFEEAATLPIAATTAWMALNWDRPIDRPVRGPQTVVLLQGTGGVSIHALQQATALGLTTIVTSSSDEKLLKAQELGATHTVNYNTTPEWADEVLNLTQGKGADIIVETGGPETMPQSVRAVAEGGVISAVGVLTGMTEEKPQLAIGLSLINRNAVLKGINIGPRDRVEEMMRLYQQEDIHPIINRCFKFDGAKDALTYMKDGFHFGKVVIKVNED